jgi:protease-4
MMRERLWRATAVTALVFLACFVTLLGVMLLGGGDLLAGRNLVGLVEVEGLIVDAGPIVQEIDDHTESSSIRAIVVRVQSPGGVVAPTQEIFGAIRRARDKGKPVVASLGAVAASGGYYLAAAANHVVASPGSLTGSIGVIIQLAEIEGLLRKVGVRYEIVKAGRFKDAGNISRPMSDEERQVLQALVDDMYDQFVTAVAVSRGLDRQRVLALADGRVYSGRRAKELGLVDTLGGLDEAIQRAAELAGIPGKPKLVRPRRPFRLADVLDWFGVQSPLGAWLGTGTGPGMSRLPLLTAPKLPLYLME